jgi:hypothetical protein
MCTITVDRGYDRASAHWFHLTAWGRALRDDLGGPGHRSHSRSRDPGAFSAHEMLMTDAYQERSLTRITSVAGTTAAELERVLNT